jgi:hypothetical protein
LNHDISTRSRNDAHRVRAIRPTKDC